MFLKEISIENFKNCQNTTFKFAKNLNCIIGRNGAGKTNLLDAVYYSSFCKSYFPLNDQLCLHKGSSFFTINSTFSNEDIDHDIIIYCSEEKDKKISCNGKKYQRLSDHIGKFPTIMVTPSDISLIDGGSSERRRFLDIFISQFDSDYLQTLVRYNKVIDQRNKLLKDARQGAGDIRDIIDIYDLQLCELGLKIDIKRREAIYEITPSFCQYYNHISKESEEVLIEYLTEVDYSDYYTVLKSNFQRDIAIGHTTKGVHRDDICLMLNGQPLKQSGSQGQKKTFLLALTFAKYTYIYFRSKKKPVLLLDDLFDKLDKIRMSAIIEIVSGEDFGQIFITDTDRDSVKDILSQFDGRYALFDFE